MIKRMVQNLLHKELSYQIHGAAIEVRKDFGSGHKEKLYQEAFAQELKRCKIPFEKEKAIKIYSPKDGKYIGLYRPDFVVDEKIILETKTEKFVSRDEIKRIYDYLRNSNYELAYFINFASPKLFIKRIIYTNDRKPSSNPPKDTNKKLINTKNLLVAISLTLVLFGGLSAKAAEISIESKTQTIAVGQQFQVDILLNTENEEINAIEGKVIFPEDLLELKEIRDGNSIVNFWIERPKINSNNQIIFSGIIPGGYIGEKGLIFSAIFQAKDKKEGLIEIQEAKTLLNDGKGTEAKLKIFNFQFSIFKQPSIPQTPISEIKDTEPPEDFEPQVASDPTMFDGKCFLVFATQDKGSGIDHYEVCEGKRKCIAAESPHLLKNQSLDEEIIVKAIDKSGNERAVTLPAQKPAVWYKKYKNYLTLAIIILVMAIAYFVWKCLWRKRKK